MHKSRLSNLVIDCQTKDLVASSRFWAAALGREVTEGNPEADSYVSLAPGAGGMNVLLQKVDHPSRVHLDIEADDVEAEASRLEALGARRVQKVQTWWVMEAPSGHRFCVVRPQSKDLDQGGNSWK